MKITDKDIDRAAYDSEYFKTLLRRKKQAEKSAKNKMLKAIDKLETTSSVSIESLTTAINELEEIYYFELRRM